MNSHYRQLTLTMWLNYLKNSKEFLKVMIYKNMTEIIEVMIIIVLTDRANVVTPGTLPMLFNVKNLSFL